MKRLLLTLLLSWAGGAQAFIDPTSALKDESAQQVSQNLSKFSNSLNDSIAGAFQWVHKFIPATDSEVGTVEMSPVHLGIIFGIFLAAFMLFYNGRKLVRLLFFEGSSLKDASVGDKVSYYVIPWIIFLIVCWGGASLFLSTVPLLKTAVIGISWVVATGVPVYRVSIISYKLDMGLKGAVFWKRLKEVASPFITLWVTYLLILEVIVLFVMISLAVVFPTMAGFGGEITSPLFDLKSDLLRLFVKGLHYFYVTNFILFLISLQQFLNFRTKKDQSFHSGFLGYIQKLRGVWFYIIYLTIAVNYFTWLGGEMGSVPLLANQSLFTFNLLLFTFLSLPIVDVVASYLSSETVYKIFSDDILKKIKLHTGFKYVFYAVYGFFVIMTLAYIWHWDAFFERLGLVTAFIGTRLITSTLLIFLAYSLTKIIQSVIRGVIAARPAEDKKYRKNNRLYSFLAILSSILPTLIWVPALIVALILFGLDGKLVFYTFAGIVAILMFVAQNVVQDIVKGTILILEDRIAIGDMVTVEGITGTVKTMTLDSLTIQDFEGIHHIVSYGSIGKIANNAWKIAPINFHIKLKDPTKVEASHAILEDIGKTIEKDKDLGKKLKRPLKIKGIQQVDSKGITIGASLVTTPKHATEVKSTLFKMIMDMFKKKKIDIDLSGV